MFLFTDFSSNKKINHKKRKINFQLKDLNPQKQTFLFAKGSFLRMKKVKES